MQSIARWGNSFFQEIPFKKTNPLFSDFHASFQRDAEENRGFVFFKPFMLLIKQNALPGY